MGEVVNRCGDWRAFEKAPDFPAEATASGSAFHETIQVDLIFLSGNIAPRAMGAYSKYSLLVRAWSKHPLEAWDAFVGSRNAVIGRSKTTQMNPGGRAGESNSG